MQPAEFECPVPLLVCVPVRQLIRLHNCCNVWISLTACFVGLFSGAERHWAQPRAAWARDAALATACMSITVNTIHLKGQVRHDSLAVRPRRATSALHVSRQVPNRRGLVACCCRTATYGGEQQTEVRVIRTLNPQDACILLEVNNTTIAAR